MKKLKKELQKLFLEDNYNVLESEMNKEYSKIAIYIRKELSSLDNLTLSQLERLEKTEKITEFYEEVCSDYKNTYKVIYAILTAKINELNKQDTNYIENDTFKLVCITHVKKYIDNLFDLVLERLNIDKKELKDAFNLI